MNKTKQFFSILCILSAHLFISAQASELEITTYIGQMYASDLVSFDDDSNIAVANDLSLGIGFSWKTGPNGQGMILINSVTHDFEGSTDNKQNSVDIIYAHFNGTALFRQKNYITTFSIGAGGAYFDANNKNELYPSITLAIGTRHEFSDSFALVTEVRGYATLISEDDELFCQNEVCAAKFDGAAWMDATISVGLAYSF